MTAYSRRIVEAPVEASMLKEAASIAGMASARESSQQQSTDPMFAVAAHFRGRGLSTDTLMAILVRMEALSNLIANGELQNWQLAGPGADGGVVVNEAVFEAAARARLIFSGTAKSRPRFKPGPFRELLLGLAVSSEGDANGSH